MSKGKLSVVLLLAALWGVWYGFFRETPVLYDILAEAATQGTLTASVTASGTLNAISVVEIGTQVSGTIESLYVDYNSPVSKGQLLAQLDPTVLRLQWNEAQAALTVAQAGVESAEAALADAVRGKARSRELYGRKLIAKSELEESETAARTRTAQLREARARAVQAAAAAERAKTNLDHTRIASPVDGVVVSRKVDVGQTVAASFQTPTLFSVARDLTRMQIDTSVDEADIGRVAEGQRAVFRVDAFPEREFEGKVVQVRIAPERTDNIVTYTVIIHLKNEDLKLKPGMTADVSIEIASRENALRVPVAALRFSPPQDLLETLPSPDAEGRPGSGLNDGMVWLVEDGRVVRPIALRTGLSDGLWVEVVSGDLKDGDSLAVAALSASRPSGRRRGPF